MNSGSFTTNLAQFAAAFAALLLLSSCAVDETGTLVLDLKSAATKKEKKKKEPKSDPKSKYHSEKHHIYVNEKVIDSVNSSNSRIEIDLGDQRARIFKMGGGKKDALAIETQISTGKQGHSTPDGRFKVLEKIVDKKSTLYGRWVDAASGATLSSDGDSRKPPSHGNAKFRGTDMPYWLRLTPGGIGMHIGYVPNAPASHGCIRVPKEVQPLIYSKVRVGTPVAITH
jgi:lipoprotein-anchoring transpeptidase ErfK/SrfK